MEMGIYKWCDKIFENALTFLGIYHIIITRKHWSCTQSNTTICGLVIAIVSI